MESQPVQRCDNCMKEFPQSKIATHFGYCRRNIKKCQVCREMFDINFKEEHQEEFHRKDKCPHCSKEFPSADFKQHERKCTLKPKFCEYCELNVPVSGFQTHFKACQSRTKPCQKCNKPIMNKDYLVHFVSCDGVKEAPRQPASYQEHIIQQQQKRQELYNQLNRVSSKEKQVIKPKQQRNYIGIVNNKTGVQQRLAYEKIVNPPRQEVQKKFTPSRPQPKREEYINPVKRIQQNNLIPPSNNIPVKKQEIRPSLGTKVTPPLSNEQKRTNGSRQAIRPQVSNKQVYKNEPIKPQIKQSKSIERNGLQFRDKYNIQNNNPKLEQPKGFDKMKVIPLQRPKQQVVRQKSPQIKNDHSQFSITDFGLTPQEQMMQEILMQSAKEQKGVKKTTATASRVPKHESKTNDMPFIEGCELTQSFIERQRAIQQQIKGKARR